MTIEPLFISNTEIIGYIAAYKDIQYMAPTRIEAITRVLTDIYF